MPTKQQPIKLEKQNVVTELIRAVSHFIGTILSKIDENRCKQTLASLP